MAVTINASTSAGLVQTADTSGVLALQTAGTTAVSISTGQVVTLTNALAEASGGTGTTTGYYGFKNRIINGAMVIDQRNAGASVTNTASGVYTLDRYEIRGNQASKCTVQQSSTAATGFVNSALVTSSSAYSVLVDDYFMLSQLVEGTNIADFGWGTANAATVTLSFWVRSSLTGTFGGALRNSAADRSYPFSYTISSANTWEQKSVTIAGDTSGTWLTTTGIGIRISFGLGVGSTYSGTASAWAGANYISATGATSVVGTNGATWYITGVQLEKGSTATSFDYRPFGTELALCQRYFEKSDNQATAILTNSRQTVSVREATNIPDQVPIGQQIFYAVTKRTSGTVTTYPFTTASNINRVSNGSGADYGASSGLAGGLTDAGFYVYNGSGGTLTVSANQTIIFNWYSSAEL
jgi:hypothetical protein